MLKCYHALFTTILQIVLHFDSAIRQKPHTAIIIRTTLKDSLIVGILFYTVSAVFQPSDN